MAFAPLGPHQFAATRNMEAALDSFMGFQLGHLRFLYFFLNFYFFFRLGFLGSERGQNEA